MILLSILCLILLISLSVLGWFTYKVTNKLLFVSRNMEDLYIRIQEFDEHIKFIYELEMYYGDETLKNLIRHSRDLKKYLTNYRNVIEVSDDSLQLFENEEEQNENDEDEDDSENKERFTKSGKTVFYSGT